MKNIMKINRWISRIDKHLLPLVVLKALATSLLPFIELYWSTRIIQMILEKDYNFIMLRNYLLYMLISYILQKALDALLSFIIRSRSFHIRLQMDKEVHFKALSLDFESLEKPETLAFIQKAKEAQNAMGGIERWIMRIGALIENSFKIVFSLAISLQLLSLFLKATPNSISTFIASYWGSVIIVVAIIVNLILQFKLTVMSNQYTLKLTSGNIETNRQAMYLVNLISNNYNYGKVIRLYDMEEMLESKLRTFNTKSYDMYRKWNDKRGTMDIISQLINAFCSSSLYIVVIARAFYNVLPGASIVFYIQALSTLFKGIFNFTEQFSATLVMCECYEPYIEFLNLSSHQTSGNLHLEKREDHEFLIRFENVSFKYPGSSSYALKNITYTFDLHTKLAIVGTNGAGKTTFIKLLCRLYKPTSGVITLNGIPIENYSFSEYIGLLSVVFQDFRLLAQPIGESIASSKSYDEEKIYQILKDVGMFESVNTQKRGLDTFLYKDNEAGIEVSGGEAQKLAIARALYKDGAYVILDEPTAALDPLSEYEIYTKFDDMVKDKTSVYISHRMSSCRFCDHILVMDKAEIVQQGHHDQLSKEDGLYKKMWNAQADYYK